MAAYEALLKAMCPESQRQAVQERVSAATKICDLRPVRQGPDSVQMALVKPRACNSPVVLLFWAAGVCQDRICAKLWVSEPHN